MAESLNEELASLSFLSFVNVSYNHLKGMIPTGTQIQSFETSSFQGNDGLYGPLLEPSIWAEPVGPARFCLSPVGPGLGFRGKNRGVGPEGPALKG